MANTVDYVSYVTDRTLREIRAWADGMANGKPGHYFDVWRLCDEALRAIREEKD